MNPAAAEFPEFSSLKAADSSAFLAFSDATSDIQEIYASNYGGGLVGHDQVKRIVRKVSIPKGTKLFKATYKELRDPLSPWWSTVLPFEENRFGVYDLMELAEDNDIRIREMIRFASAVSVDWNPLENYVEIVLDRSVDAYFGQFAPQKGVQDYEAFKTKIETRRENGQTSDYVSYDSEDADPHHVYLPEMLGGIGAWQLYIPNFERTFVEISANISIKLNDDELLKYLKRS